jgi:carboxylesterase
MDPRAADVLIQNGNKKAVLLVHGFSSGPWLFHKHIPLFEAAGYDVVAPRLPGHGISPEAFVKSSFTQYYNKVEESLLEYRPQYDGFHIIGISMGGLLTLKLAEEYSGEPQAPDSIITLAAPYLLKDPGFSRYRF